MIKVDSKKLISTQDISEMLANKQNKCFFSSNTIITQAAQDLANKHGLKLIEQSIKEFDDNELLSAFSQLLKKPALLKRVIEALTNSELTEKVDASGVKIIKAQPANQNSKLRILEKDVLGCEVGIIYICDEFEEKNESESLKIVLSGQIDLIVGDNVYPLSQQDIITVPENIPIRWKCAEIAKIIYVEK